MSEPSLENSPEFGDDFARRLAAPTPTPGGGAAAARSGLYATALLRMVTSITRTRARRGNLDDEGKASIVDLERRAEELGARFASLEAADIEAFQAYLSALALPRGTEDEKALRSTALRAAARRATEVPLETASAALEALTLASLVLELGNRIRLRAESDIGVALELAQAAFRGAGWNVLVNLPTLGDARPELESRHEHLTREFEPLYASIRERLRERLA